jgi:hypothetical protein
MNGDERTAIEAATKRVLIIDDDPGVLAVLREIFAVFRHGHTYEVATLRQLLAAVSCSE